MQKCHPKIYLIETDHQDGHMMGCRLVIALAFPSLAELLCTSTSHDEEDSLMILEGVSCGTIR